MAGGSTDRHYIDHGPCTQTHKKSIVSDHYCQTLLSTKCCPRQSLLCFQRPVEARCQMDKQLYLLAAPFKLCDCVLFLRTGSLVLAQHSRKSIVLVHY